MKKFITLVFIFLLLLTTFSGDLSAKTRKHGVELIIVKKNREIIRGELIAVKPTSILTMEEVADLSIDIIDIKYIKIVSKAELLRSSGIGLILGGVGGALIGKARENSTGMSVGVSSVVGGILGELLFGLIGGKAGVVETIYFEGKSPEEIKKAIKKLNSLARIRQKIQ